MDFPKRALLAIVFALTGCASLKKDNEPKSPPEVKTDVQEQLDVYRPLIAGQLDAYGLVRLGGSVGDSALFSCLARVAGVTHFDPAILFVNGKPIRHPDMHANPGGSDTPTSKDMVEGAMWCLYDLIRHGEQDHARQLVFDMIAFGKAHKLKVGTELGWLFCTEEDRAEFKISDEDWLGKCFMPPGIVKDIYRIAKASGLACDDTCQFYSTVGFNIPADKKGFERHLAVLTTLRNGLVDGAINDNSLRTVLERAATEQPRNALFVGAFHLFGDGIQNAAFAALGDENLFPRDHLPTKANYCTEYLFQRDDDSQDGPGADWLPCGDGQAGAEGRGVEYALAASLALGELTAPMVK